jgi:hypothetical protein
VSPVIDRLPWMICDTRSGGTLIWRASAAGETSSAAGETSSAAGSSARIAPG